MKIKKLFGWSSALCLSVTLLQAQETNEVELLRKQLQGFESIVRQQQQQIDTLTKRLDEVTKTPPTAAAKAPFLLRVVSP